MKIDGRCLRPLQQFTLDVSAEEIAEGGEFKRDLLLGNFQPTKQIDYCIMSTNVSSTPPSGTRRP